MNAELALARPKQYALIALACLTLTGCTSGAAPEKSPAAPVGFVNRVWTVRQSSSVEPGSMYVFLSGGTLVLTSPHGTPAFGTWKDEAGALTMVEESRPYPAEIVQLGADELHLRIHGPGEPVDLAMVPAESPPRAR